jgi:transcription-repair coupling factor (superfamily II helicase)
MDFDLLLRRLADASARRCDLVRTGGGSLGLLLASLAQRPGMPPILAVTTDGEEARRLASDVSFFFGSPEDRDAAEEGRGEVLLLPAPEQSPYVDVAPDRRTTMARLATLFHLSQGLPWRVLIAPAAALARKLVPRAALGPRCDLVQAEELVDRDALLRGLTEGGYLRVPVVEDPGTFAARGAVIDVWTPSSRWPARIELDEELCLTIKLFDPEGQRTIRTVKELFVHPVREALVGDVERTARARPCATSSTPWRCPRCRGRSSSTTWSQAARSSAPRAFCPRTTSPWSRSTPTSRPSSWCSGTAPTAPSRSSARSSSAPGATTTPRSRSACRPFPTRRTTSTPTRPCARCHGTARSSPTRSPCAPPSASPAAPSRTSSTSTPTVRCLTWAASRSRGSRPTSRARAPSAARPTRSCPSWSRCATGNPTATGSSSRAAPPRRPSASRPCCAATTSAVNAVPRGLLAPTRAPASAPRRPRRGRGGRAGPGLRAALAHARGGHRGGGLRRPRPPQRPQARQRRQRRAPFSTTCARSPSATSSCTSTTASGSYLGLEHRKLGASETDLLVIEYAGGDKLFLPVTRLNQIQKFSGGEATPRSTASAAAPSRRAKAKVARAVRQMADELLRLYAERKAHPGRAFPSPDMLYKEFEATFPFEETNDQLKAIDDVLTDLERSTPDGPTRLRRRGLRQDRGGHARGLSRRLAGRAGGRAVPHHGARAAALPHLLRAHGCVSAGGRGALALRHQRRAARDLSA